MEHTVTMCPPRSFMYRMASSVPYMGPKKFTSTICRCWSLVRSRAQPVWIIPALFTRMSPGPSCRSTSRKTVAPGSSSRPSLSTPHGRERAVHGAKEIHVHHLPVLVIGEVTCPAGVDHPGVVHQDVHRAELPFHVPEDRGPRFFVADVVFHTDGADVLG